MWMRPECSLKSWCNRLQAAWHDHITRGFPPQWKKKILKTSSLPRTQWDSSFLTVWVVLCSFIHGCILLLPKRPYFLSQPHHVIAWNFLGKYSGLLAAQKSLYPFRKILLQAFTSGRKIPRNTDSGCVFSRLYWRRATCWLIVMNHVKKNKMLILSLRYCLSWAHAALFWLERSWRCYLGGELARQACFPRGHYQAGSPVWSCASQGKEWLVRAAGNVWLRTLLLNQNLQETGMLTMSPVNSYLMENVSTEWWRIL